MLPVVRPNTSPELAAKYKRTCWKKYPKANVFVSILTYGIHGATRQKRRNDCLRAAAAGRPDPRAKKTGSKAVLGKAYKLWAIKEPWGKRPRDTAGNVARVVGWKTGGDALRSIAKGQRPWGKRYIDLERKATILGGLTALQTIGTRTAWLVPDLKVALKLRGDPNGLRLLKAAQQVAQADGDVPPKNLQRAAEYVRRKVIAEEAGGPAWMARALYLALAGTTATAKRAKVESAVATSLGVAGAALDSTGIGAIVGVPLQALGLGFAAASGRSQVEQTRAQEDAKLYTQKFQSMLQARQLRQENEALEAQLAQAEEVRAQEEQRAQVFGLWAGRILTVAVGAAVVGSIGYVLTKHRRTWS